MEFSFTKTAKHYQRRRQWNKTWKKVTMVLASVVVFVTTYALILPAITLEPEYVCNKEAHTHTDACYQLPEDTPVSTVTYTVKFKTANYNGEKAIVSYTIHDTLPNFLINVNVTGITVDGTAIATQQFTNQKIVLDWYDETKEQHLYKNGAEVVITYTAVVTDKAAIDGAGNTNTITLTWNDKEGLVKPTNPDQYKDSETIYTYALALKKVNDKGDALAGATFQFPFYVKSTPDADGAYIYAGTEAVDGLINEITTPEDGVIIVKGLESGVAVSITETAAPVGYNKLTAPVIVTPVQTGSTTTNVTVYLDENGNITETETKTETAVTVVSNKIAATAIVVVNKAGTELPSTGGMGTTIFYAVGGIMVVAAVVLLVTKKRMSAEG